MFITVPDDGRCHAAEASPHDIDVFEVEVERCLGIDGVGKE